MSDEAYVKQQLEWVRRRMEVLDEIDIRLREMRSLAEYARDNLLSPVDIQRTNDKIRLLQEEIAVLDEKGVDGRP